MAEGSEHDDELEVRVSRHGRERAVQRLGIPRRAVERMARRAFAAGVERLQTKGDLRRYLDNKYRIEAREPQYMRVYGEHVYIFGLDGTFVTTWRLPSSLRRLVRR